MPAQLYRVIVSPRAFEELDAILEYVAGHSPANAAKVIAYLWKSMQALQHLPRRYRVVRGAGRPKWAVRRMPVPPYLVYYRVDEVQKVVRILTIRHGSQRQPKRFG